MVYFVKKLEIFGCCQMPVDRRALDHRADLSKRLYTIPAEILAEYVYLAALLFQQSENKPKRRSLARAVRPEKAINAALIDLDVNAVKDRRSVAERMGQASCL